MINLIKKDIMLMKKSTVIFLIPLLMVITFIFFKSPIPLKSLGYVFIIFVTTYYSYSSLEVYKNNFESMIINSLPVSRNDIVMEKYLFLIICGMVFSVISILETNVLNVLQLGYAEPSNMWTAIITLNISLIYFSFFIPISIKSNGDMAKLNMFMFAIIFILPEILKRFLLLSIGQRLLSIIYKIPNMKVFHVAFLFIALLMYLVSLGISLKLYKNKEF